MHADAFARSILVDDALFGPGSVEVVRKAFREQVGPGWERRGRGGACGRAGAVVVPVPVVLDAAADVV